MTLTVGFLVGARSHRLLGGNTLHRTLPNRESRVAIRGAEVLEGRNLLAPRKTIVCTEKRDEAVLRTGGHHISQCDSEVGLSMECLGGQCCRNE